MKKKIERKELFIDNFNNVNAISLVKSPAIEIDFLKFNDTKSNYCFAKVDTDKRILTGPAMIPDKDMYRFNKETNEEYYVYFSKETVDSISQEYLISNKNHNVTLQHEKDLDGVCLVESWIVTDKDNDKAFSFGYDIPVGTWMVSMKVTDDNLWKEIKESENINGFSIEGWFVSNFNEQLVDEEKEVEDFLRNELDGYDIDFEDNSPETILKEEMIEKKIATFLQKKLKI
jgi:hypothetical protein